MSRKKKYILSAAAVLCALLVLLVYLLAIRPYLQSRPSFTVKDTLPDGGGKKATVIILGGQSNASGCSLDEPADTPDLAHYDSMSEIKLGHLFAEEIMKYLD